MFQDAGIKTRYHVQAGHVHFNFNDYDEAETCAKLIAKNNPGTPVCVTTTMEKDFTFNLDKN